MSITRNFIVSGRVQGVGFRYATKRMAESLRLRGWVRNLPGGEVEIEATGDARKLAEFETWLWDGPQYARVSGVARHSPAGGGGSRHISNTFEIQV